MIGELYLRWLILNRLKEGRAIEKPTAFMDLLRVMDLLGPSLSPRALRENLEYLAAKGCVELFRKRDLPGFMISRLGSTETPDHIEMIKLTPKAVDILEGSIRETGIFTG